MGNETRGKNTDYMFLNMGPNHPSVHGVFRIAVQLNGEEVVDAVADIGYHHRGAEKWESAKPGTPICPTPTALITSVG